MFGLKLTTILAISIDLYKTYKKHIAIKSRLHCNAVKYFTQVYRVGQKRKLLILSEYVNKTEKIGAT